MKRNRRAIFVLTLLPMAFFLAFTYWYQGISEPLTAEEVSRYMNIIESQPQNPGGRHKIPALRDFLENDDGKPFYTVNLYKYFDQATYQDAQMSNVTGREAFDRFTRVMVPLLIQHASHPIFGSNQMLETLTGWDRLVIVRYRSRRDIADIFASSEFAEASKHKWAALEKNERMLVQGVHIPELFIAAIAITIVWSLVAFCIRGSGVRIALRTSGGVN
ncbi:hypothetical protein BTA51_01955 [Hahella sp. CCB-MM4]|uniref:DUF1330 domain-containing protein n=1 Tax=Hahella sp. (strain CCB-MM4) TaxID=1926491 RepID=UPI000B9AFE0E|nr:DUF1330 domain-containing protein [Hahella sp. CCB-MM4]OZG75173.1 hypothetical protein BTA51_01955 [Hahella sp. CCB-MM4]